MVFSTEGWRRNDQRARAKKGAGRTIVGRLILTNGRQVFERWLPCVSFVVEMNDSEGVFFHKTSEFRDTHHQIPLAFRFFRAKRCPRSGDRIFFLNR